MDAAEARREATGTDYPGLRPVIEVIVEHMGVALDDGTVEGLLLSVVMEDADEGRPPSH